MQCDSDNRKWYKYVCIATNQPDTKSNPSPTTKQHAIVNIQLNTATSPMYPDKFVQDNAVAPSAQTALLLVVIVTLPVVIQYCSSFYCARGFPVCSSTRNIDGFVHL